MESSRLQVILGEVITVAKDAGLWIQAERLNFSADKIEIKGLNDLVSYVDRGAEQKIINDLNNIFPAGFIAEESKQQQRQEYNWIIDPLDGTTNYIHGVPCYAVSIALEYNNDIILGVVYEVTRDECFYAIKGGGSFLNSRSIEVSKVSVLKDSLVATGFPIHNFSKMEAYLKSLEQMMRNTHGVRRLGSAATDLCYLACGRFDAFFEYNLSPWDVAAGALIVKEAGGTVSDFRGGHNWLFGKEMIASNTRLANELMSTLHL
jgi:myo-inositol-1(or 4)-monophosphatase